MVVTQARAMLLALCLVCGFWWSDSDRFRVAPINLTNAHCRPVWDPQLANMPQRAPRIETPGLLGVGVGWLQATSSQLQKLV